MQVLVVAVLDVYTDGLLALELEWKRLVRATPHGYVAREEEVDCVDDNHPPPRLLMHLPRDLLLYPIYHFIQLPQDVRDVGLGDNHH